jgi:hypothetical protein
MENYGKKGYPEHLIQTVKDVYKGLIISTDKDTSDELQNVNC